MNKTFKTKWSSLRQQYIVTDEKHVLKGKASKNTVTLAIAAVLAIASGTSSAAYVEKGVVGNQASWESAEYQKDWGLAAMNASKAYSLGFNGQNVAVGVMDSGALLQKHPELAGNRFHASSAQGKYGSTGNRYQTGVRGIGDVFKNGDYKEGESFNLDGNFIAEKNDTHGTHVTGTVGANRDGSEFHGVAWGANVYVGNSGGTDNTNYGPFQDYKYFHAAWSSLAQDLIAANGTERGGVINNSFGTNLRYGASGGTSLPVNSTAQTEYEYFLFKQVYGDKKTFVDAAWDAVKGTNVVQVFTTGNRDFANPYYRPLYPYFSPEAERNWIAVAGLQKDGVGTDGKDTYKWISNFNEAGNAKWWTIAAPGRDIYSSIVYDDHYEDTDALHPLGTPGYASYGGTSMAAPHVSGAMTVLMSRYQDMNAIQVRDILFTTARHTNSDGSLFTGWTAEDGVPDVLYGWGTPDLDKGMFGPSQLLGKFEYKVNNLDVWSNDISQKALDARKVEDQAWMKATTNGTDTSAVYELGEAYTGMKNIENAVISKEDAEKWRQEYYKKRAEAIQNKIDNALYDGSLVKNGDGTIVLTGNNTFRGGVTLNEGSLYGFNDSFGITEPAAGKANGLVTVNGGKFGVVNKYDDKLTLKGTITDGASDHSVDAVINAGGTFLVMAGQDVEMGTLTFKDGAGYSVSSTDIDVLKAAYEGNAQTGTVKLDKLTGLDTAVANPDYALFKTELTFDETSSILTGTLSADKSLSLANYGSGNGRKIGQAIDAERTGALFESLLSASKAQVESTYASLGDDFYLNSRNASIVNGLTLTRAVKDQAAGIGEGRVVEMADGNGRLWATGIGAWSSIDYGSSNMDSNFYAGLIGAEVDVAESTKIGVFFGAGTTENKAGSFKVESNDIHVGLYGLTNIEDIASIHYGFIYTHQSVDANRTLTVKDLAGYNKWSGDADVTQIFAEAAFKGFNTAAYSVEPYFGLAWIHAESDGYSESVGGMTFITNPEDQDLQVSSLGIRAGVPFSLGAAKVTLKGDLAWNHFFGDTEAEARMNLAGSGTALIKGGELSDMATVGLGVEAQLSKTATFGLSYTGAYDGDVTMHGLRANLRFAF